MHCDMPNTGDERKVAERLGEAVRAKRATLRLSQQELAKLALVSPSRVSEIERADSDPRLSTVEKVTDALGLTLTVESAA
jgi:transcriptional regulator with XRE-family HTH domain